MRSLLSTLILAPIAAACAGLGHVPPDFAALALDAPSNAPLRLLVEDGEITWLSVPLGADLSEAAERVGYPLVLKVYGPKIIHKSDFGGVVVGIENSDQLQQAAQAISRSLEKSGVGDEVEGLLVQEMADAGKEVILGMTTDPQFGPLLMFGMGGKYVEITQDIAFRVMPVTDVDALDMVKAIRSYPLLEGIRGEERVDIEFIVDSIQRLAQLVNDFPKIAELDLNPVIITPGRTSCKVVDARVRLA